MPIYHFSCKECGNRFELLCSIRDKENKQAKCPACGSVELSQLFGGIGIKTRPCGSSGGSCGGNCSCCGGCGS